MHTAAVHGKIAVGICGNAFMGVAAWCVVERPNAPDISKVRFRQHAALG